MSKGMRDPYPFTSKELNARLRDNSAAGLTKWLLANADLIHNALKDLEWIDDHLSSDEDGNFSLRFYAPCDPDSSIQDAIAAYREDSRQRAEKDLS